jgi:nicotinamide riboside transporter PnuC
MIVSVYAYTHAQIIKRADAMLDSAASWLLLRTWVEVAEAVFVVLSIVGQHYNSERNKVGFYYWGSGNAIAIVLFIAIGRWLTAMLYTYFLWKCITGVRRWTQIENEQDHRAKLPANAESGAAERECTPA